MEVNIVVSTPDTELCRGATGIIVASIAVNSKSKRTKSCNRENEAPKAPEKTRDIAKSRILEYDSDFDNKGENE